MPRHPRSQLTHSAAKLSGQELSLGEMVHILRTRAGYVSHQELSDAVRSRLPDWVPMNRRYVQMIESGDLGPEEVNDLWLVAIAKACKEKPDVFGLVPGETPDVDPLAELLIESGWCQRKPRRRS